MTFRSDVPVNSSTIHFVNGVPIMGPFPAGCESLVVGMGCFWGAERKFWQAPGVVTTSVGYAGGDKKHPTYKEVCSGRTGHTEVVMVVFDTTKTTLDTMLRVFWENHDPTQGNRQGNDIGTQYRSAIFVSDDLDRESAEAAIARWNADNAGAAVTTVEGPATWYPAEDYHQEYWEGEGQRNPYCLAVIPPKLQKLRKSFAAKVKA